MHVDYLTQPQIYSQMQQYDSRSSRHIETQFDAEFVASESCELHEESNLDVDDDVFVHFSEHDAHRIRTNSSSIGSCSINLLNTLAGTGMLGLPFAYSSSGFVMGTVLLVFAAFFSGLGLHLLAVSAATVKERTNIRTNQHVSFNFVAAYAMPKFANAIDIAIALKCFGVSTGYFITIADCMTDAFHYILRNINPDNKTSIEEIETDLFGHRRFWMVIAVVLVLPISFFKTLDKLKFTSTLALILIYGLAIGIVLYAEDFIDPCPINSHSSVERHIEDRIQDSVIHTMSSELGSESCRGPTFEVTDMKSTLENLPIFIFSFTCHQNIFAVVDELKSPTRRRVFSVIHIAILSGFLLYLVVAIEGYRTFGSEVNSNILLNYPQTGLVTMMRIGLTIMVIFSYPLQLDPSRRCLTSLIFSVLEKREKDRQRLEHERLLNVANEGENGILECLLEEIHDSLRLPSDDSPNIHPSSDYEMENESVIVLESCVFYGITITFIALTFIVAEAVEDLGTVLGVVGATGSTMVSYILPASIYINLHGSRNYLGKLACIQLALGIVIMPTTLYYILFEKE